MSESRRDRWLSIAMSVLLHGTLIGLLVFGWWHFREKAPPRTLSIDATVVNPRTLKGVGFGAQPAQQPRPKPKPKPKPVPPQPVPVSQGPPMPTPQEQALRAQAAQAEERHQAEAEQELQKRKAAKQAAEAEQKAAARARQKAQRQAEAARQAKARKLAEEKKRAEQKKRAEEKKLAAERAAERKAARAAALAQLRRNLRQEEQSDAQARAGLAGWTQQIEGRIEDAWIRPPTANAGIDCILNVTLVPGGTVTNVSIGRCNGDGAVKESIEAAVYRASPLPAPPDPALFQRQLIIEFKPN